MTTTSSSDHDQLMVAIAQQQLIVSPETSVIAAIAMMGEMGASCAIVSDSEGWELMGIFTDRDLVRVCMQSVPLAQLTMQSVMSYPVITIQETVLDNINDVLILFQMHQIRHLPVLNGDRFMGVLTKDVLTEILAQMVLNSSDITARKQAELELQKSEQRYRALMDGASDAILLADPQGKLIEANQKAEELLGYSRDEMKRLHMSQIHPPEALEAARNHFKNVRENNFAPAMESLVLRKDGRQIPVEITGSCVELDGEIIAQGIFRDISDRKQAEIALWQANQELNYHIENSPLATIIWDQEFRVRRWSARAEEIFGWKSDEVLGKNFFDWKFVYEPDIPSVQEVAAQILKDGRASCHNRNYCKDGSIIYCDWDNSVLLDAAGHLVSMTSLIQDVSDRKQIESKLIESETKFRHLVEEGNDLIWSGDHGVFTYLSPQFKNMFGWDSHEWIGRTYVDLIHPDDISSLWSSVPNTQSEQKTNIAEFRHKHQDGRYIWVRNNTTFTLNSEGVIIGSQGILTNINDRKQAEIQLQNLNEQLRQSVLTLERSNALLTVMQEASFDGILVIDEHRRVLTYNQQFVRQWFIPQEIIAEGDDRQLLAVALSQLTNPNEFLELVEYLYENPQKISRDEISFIDGRTFDRYSAPIYWNNKHYGRIWFFRDISDRKQAELSLQQEIFRRDTIFNASSDGIHILDIEGNLLESNDKFAQMLGYTPAEIVGFNVAEWDAQWTPEELREVLRIDSYNDRIFETLHRRKDGSIFPVEISRRVMEWQGKLSLVNISRDISDRKQAELALQESQTFAQKIADASPNILYLYDIQEQRNIYANREISSVLGYAPEVIQAMGSDLVLNIMHPDDIKNVLPKYYDQVIAAQDGEIIESEYRMRHANGEWRWLSSRDVVFSRDDMGQVKQTLGVAEDISDRKKYEQQLKQTNAELIRATRLKDEFLAAMSHELRTPLNAILGMTEGLQEEVFGTLNERQLRALQTIERSGCHLLELINDILDVAKIDAGQVELNYEPIAIAQLAQSSLIFIKQQAHKKRIQIKIQIAPNLPDISIDERRIRQVLINLLNNAVKFTPEDGQIKVEVDRQEDRSSPSNSSWLRFSISDTGIGIAPENIPKLFQPFIQIDSALNRKYEGTGLGLALVKQIVDLHGGKVSLTSKLGVGSCFVVDIPYKSSILTPPESQTQISLNLEIDKPERTISPLILIAEDNETNINTISDYLEFNGYRLVIARDGAEAIALAKSHQPDIILMDIQMPVMDGLEAIQQIRLDPQLINTPIIALTALAMTGDRDRCLAAGANEYLSKPVKLKELVETIQNML